MNRKHARTKRVLGMVLALVLILSQSVFTIPVQAATVPTDTVFTVGSDSAMAGESFSIPISVKDCAHFYALGLEILYDETVFELTGIALHDDRNPLTGYEMDLPDNISEGTLNIVKTGTGNMAFEDGPILLLTFKVLEDAMTNPYEIGLKVSDADWANWEEELLEGTFIAGAIQVTGIDGEAEYAGYQYPTLIEAMEAAAGSGSPALVKVLKHIQIDHEDDHLIIPFGADITLDMNGKTIMADYAGGHLIEVESGGKLTLTSTAGARGKFVYAERPAYDDWGPDGLSFLINEGTLSMSRVDVQDFWLGLADGLFVDYVCPEDPLTGMGGTFDLIEDCDFDTVFTAIGLGGSTVGTIGNCLIVADAFPVAFGIAIDPDEGDPVEQGTVDLIVSSTILSRRKEEAQIFGSLCVLAGWTVEEVRDSILAEHPEAMASNSVATLMNQGTINSITSSSSETFTLIEGPYLAIDNFGTIGLIEGVHTTIRAGNIAISNVGTVTEISGGLFQSANGHAIVNMAFGWITEITGGTFVSNSESTNSYALINLGTIDEISGGTFQNDAGSALNNRNNGSILEISGGTFLSSAGSAFTNNATIGEISGGIFQSESRPALETLELGTIQSISGGVFEATFAEAVLSGGMIAEVSGGRFLGYSAALACQNEDWHYGRLIGGYYKVTQGDTLLDAYAYSSIEGVMSTNPLQDGEQAGYYHLGEKWADVVWYYYLENQYMDRYDFFIAGDPIYFPLAIEAPEGEYFQGWDDGENFYEPGESLPVAVVGDFLQFWARYDLAQLPDDYKIVLESNETNVNANDDFLVDLLVTSKTNDRFFGATVEITFENNKLDYQEGMYPEGFNIIENSEGDLTTLLIVGAYLGEPEEGEEGGFEIKGDGFKLATLSFKAKGDIETGTTLIKIGEGPIVDQSGAVFSEEVGKGEDLTIHLWNLKVTFVAGQHVTLSGDTIASVRYDEAGLYADTTYTDPFDEPGRTPDSHYTLDIPVWKPAEGDNVDFPSIKALVFTGNATYTATASPSKYTIVSYPEVHTTFTLGAVYVEGVGYEVTYLTDVTFAMAPTDGYSVKTVTYQVGSDAPVTLTPDNGVYTIPGGEIKGDITIAFGQEVVGEIVFTDNDVYRALPSGYKLMELRVTGKLGEGEAYQYDGVLMFYSTKYSEQSSGLHIYVFVVPNTTTEEGARALIQIVEGKTCEELAYSFDVNGDGRVNSTDVVLTYGFYKGVHSLTGEFGLATMKMRLNADINGDRKVETDDAQAILDHIWS